MRTNLLEQPEIDVSNFKRKTRIINDVEEITVELTSVGEMTAYKNIFKTFCNKIWDITIDVTSIIRRSEYIIIVLPMLAGIPVGSYDPLLPRIRFSFYATNQMKIRSH